MEAFFYHLERKALEEVLPELLERTLARGWRAVIRPGSLERAEALDGHLWSYRDDSFLPHGLAREPHAAAQPILIDLDQRNTNAAQILFLVDGAEPRDWQALAALGFERTALIFDGRDANAVAAARESWKSAKAASVPAQYWQQNAAGKWENKAQS